MGTTQSGWYSDPTGRYLYRYWDGEQWTQQVGDGGQSGADPTELDPEMATTPPAPGTRAAEPSSATPTIQVSQRGGGFGAGAIVGILIALLLVVIVVVALVSNTGDDEPDPGATTTTTTAETTEAP